MALEQIREQAERELLEIVGDNNRWNLFLKQVRLGLGIDLAEHEEPRERVKNEEVYRGYVRNLYILCSIEKICDSCDFNPKQRGGKRRFTDKRVFHCNHRKTQGNVFAEYTEVICRKGDEEELLELLGEYDSGEIDAKELLEKTKVIGSLENGNLSGGYYMHNNPEWSRAYRELSQEVIERHTDSTKPPEWLNVENNLCPNYYHDDTC